MEQGPREPKTLLGKLIRDIDITSSSWRTCVFWLRDVTPSHITSLDVTPSEVRTLEVLTSRHYTFGKLNLRNITPSEYYIFGSYTFGCFTFGTLHL